MGTVKRRIASSRQEFKQLHILNWFPDTTSADAVVDRQTIGEFIRIHRKKAFFE